MQLAGLAALLTGGLLLLAHLARLGFLANFLSRTVLLGFLTGVGIQVAAGQLPDMLGINAAGTRTLTKLADTLGQLPHAHWPTAGGVGRRHRGHDDGPADHPPGARGADRGDRRDHCQPGRGAVRARRGRARRRAPGLPQLGPPTLSWHAARILLGASLSMFVVILAQSAATSRAYAVKYEEPFTEDTDLVGLGAANIAAAFSGTFVVNGSPTKTQMVDSAGGRGQLAQLTTSALVLIVLLLLTGPLAYLPIAALAAVVFLIAVELIDINGMRRILSVRRHEFAVAVLTTVAVVVIGVQNGIAVAVIASVIDHLRHSYHPRNSVLVKSPAGHWQALPVTPGARTEPGLVVYRFGTSLYYANAFRLIEDLLSLVQGSPIRWFVLDCTAIGDVDYTASMVLVQAVRQLHERHIRFVVADVLGPVRQQLGRYGITAAVGPEAYYDTPGEALEAFQATRHS